MKKKWLIRAGDVNWLRIVTIRGEEGKTEWRGLNPECGSPHTTTHANINTNTGICKQLDSKIFKETHAGNFKET